MDSEFVYCRNCRGYMRRGRSVFCDEDCKLEYRSSPTRRHPALLKLLERERVPETDKLYSLEFYASLIADGCTYCQGPLAPTGHGLDKIVNSLGHRCWNVCAACSICNRLKSGGEAEGGFSFEEMATILGPAVRDIRRRREAGQKKK